MLSQAALSFAEATVLPYAFVPTLSFLQGLLGLRPLSAPRPTWRQFLQDQQKQEVQEELEQEKQEVLDEKGGGNSGGGEEEEGEAITADTADRSSSDWRFATDPTSGSTYGLLPFHGLLLFKCCVSQLDLACTFLHFEWWLLFLLSAKTSINRVLLI